MESTSRRPRASPRLQGSGLDAASSAPGLSEALARGNCSCFWHGARPAGHRRAETRRHLLGAPVLVRGRRPHVPGLALEVVDRGLQLRHALGGGGGMLAAAPLCAQRRPVQRQVKGAPVKQSAKLTGEPTKRAVKPALRITPVSCESWNPKNPITLKRAAAALQMCSVPPSSRTLPAKTLARPQRHGP